MRPTADAIKELVIAKRADGERIADIARHLRLSRPTVIKILQQARKPQQTKRVPEMVKAQVRDEAASAKLQELYRLICVSDK